MSLLVREEMLVRDRRPAYLSISRYATGSSMSTEERDAFDADLNAFVKQFGDELELLKKKASTMEAGNADLNLHYRLVVLILYTRLQSLVEMVREMRAERSQRLKTRPDAQRQIARVQRDPSPAIKAVQSTIAVDERPPDEALLVADQQEQQQQQQQQMEQLSAHQVQELEHENAALLAALDADMSAVRTAETRLGEIAELFSQFSTKVLEQQSQIDTIYSNVVDSKSNMDMTLHQLMRTLKHSVHFRLNILVIFVVAALSLLFLDWFQA